MVLSRRAFAKTAACAVAALEFGAARASTPSWQTLKLGAGGQITGISIGPDGSKALRTDVGGAYVRDSTLWRQVLRAPGFPEPSPGGSTGVSEIVICPGTTSQIYMYFYQNIYFSPNRGNTWTKTHFGGTSRFYSDPNGNNKWQFPIMAVDPANSNIVFVGTPSNGMWATSNGGLTWSRISEVSIGAVSNVVAFDPISPIVNGATQGIYTATDGMGVYHSNNGGRSWMLLDSGLMPTKVSKLIVDQFGRVWALDSNGVHQWDGSAWKTAFEPGRNIAAFIAVDPTSSTQSTSKVYCLYAGTGANGGVLVHSVDGGTTWSKPGGFTLSSEIIPWASWANDPSLSPAMMAFDPSQPNTLYMAGGIGVWSTKPTSTFAATHWTFDSEGIEELVMNWAVKPPGQNLVLAAWDRPLWVVSDPNKYPTRYYPNAENEIVPCWSVDWCSSDPRFVVAVLAGFSSTARGDISGVLTNNGSSYKQFLGKPAPVTDEKGAAGCIAASTPKNFVWAVADGNGPYFTVDGGATWTAGVTPQSGTGGWGSAFYLKQQIVCADRVLNNTFYIYNNGGGSHATDAGIYRSLDGGANWSHVYSGKLGTFSTNNFQIKAVPGYAENIFASPGGTPGALEPHAGQLFYYSQDGGKTWKPVPHTWETWAFGFGKPATPAGYPTIFVYGWVNIGAGYKLGAWMSTNLGITWIRLSSEYIDGSFDGVAFVEGDDEIYGRCYVGFYGTGCKYYGV